MNHSMSTGRHLAGMLAAAGAILGGLVLFGVPAAAALRYAVLLACPVMMVWMMASMSRRPPQDHDRFGGR